MEYISIPISFQPSEQGFNARVERNIQECITMMDNLVELIVFTPRGSFNADPDFGFEYWNYEFINVSGKDFNTNVGLDEYSQQSAKERCETSIAENILAYVPEKLGISNVIVDMSMQDYKHKGVDLCRKVVIDVSAKFNGGTGTECNYNHKISFMVEPQIREI